MAGRGGWAGRGESAGLDYEGAMNTARARLVRMRRESRGRVPSCSPKLWHSTALSTVDARAARPRHCLVAARTDALSFLLPAARSEGSEVRTMPREPWPRPLPERAGQGGWRQRQQLYGEGSHAGLLGQNKMTHLSRERNLLSRPRSFAFMAHRRWRRARRRRSWRSTLFPSARRLRRWG